MNVADLPSVLRRGREKIRKMKRLNEDEDPIAVIKKFFRPERIPPWVLSTGMGPEELHSDYYVRDPNHRFVWCPKRFSDPGSGEGTRKIYATLVNRLDALEDLYREVDTGEGREHSNVVRRSIREIQDSFVLLTLHMESNDCYLDSEITNGISGSYQPSPMEMFCPGKDKVFDVEQLPDLFVHVFYCQFWGNSTETPFKDYAVNKIIKILNKALPFACKGREVAKQIANNWTKKSDRLDPEASELIFDVIIRIIMGGLLGVYEHCKVILNFRARRKIYKWFSLMLPDKKVMADWVTENKYLVMYILREYLFYVIREITPLYAYLDENYRWYDMMTISFEAMDDARQMFNSSASSEAESYPVVDPVFPQTVNNDIYEREKWYFQWSDLSSENKREPWDDWFRGVPKMLARYKDLNLKISYRPMEMTFVEKVVGVSKKLEDPNFRNRMAAKLRKRKKPVLTTMIVGPKNEDRPKLSAADVTDRDREIVKRVVEVFQPYEPIEPDFFVPWFNLSLESALDIQRAQLSYLTETSKNDVEKVLCAMALEKEYDYELLKTFFSAVDRHRSLLIYDAPEHIREKQLKTFSKYYGEDVTENPELLEQLGTYYVCPNCCQFKAKVYDSDYVCKKERTATDDGGGGASGDDRRISVTKDDRKEITDYDDDEGPKGSAASPVGGSNNKTQKEEKVKLVWIAKRESIDKEISMCSEGISIDVTTGTVYCSRSAAKTNTKKRISHLDVVDDVMGLNSIEEKEIRKATKDNRKNAVLRECPNTPLMRISMIGKMLWVKNVGTVILCPECACVTTMTRDGYRTSDGLFSCRCSKKVRPLQTEPSRLCDFCHQPIRRKNTNKTATYRIALDDQHSDPSEWRLRVLELCSVHSFRWLEQWKRIWRLSEIRRAVDEHLISVPLGTEGDRILKEPPKDI